MKKVRIFLILALTPFLFTCQNSIDFALEEKSCDVFISNLRYEVPKINDQLYTLNGDSLYPRQLYEFYFDYDGDCLDSNAYFIIEYDGFYAVDENYDDKLDSYANLGKGQIKYLYKPTNLVDLGNKIRLGIVFIFNQTEVINISVQGFYNGYEPSTGFVQKETNKLHISFEKLDEML